MASSSVLCDPSQEQSKYVNAITFCIDCQENLCSDCSSYHRSLKATRNHHLVDTDIASDLSEEVTKHQYCIKHTKLPLEYFCTYHDIVCCRACLADDHKSCDKVVPLEMACENAKTSLKSVNDDLQNMLKTVNLIESVKTNRKSQLNNEGLEIAKQIKEAKLQAMQQLDKIEDDLLTELEIKKNKRLEIIEESIRETEEMKNEITEQTKIVQLIEKYGSNKQIFILTQDLKGFLTKTDGSLSNIASTNSITTLYFKMTESSVTNLASFGTITQSTQIVSIPYKSLKQEYAQYLVLQPNKTLTSFERVSQFNNKTQNVYVGGMLATDDDKLLLCNVGGQTIDIYNQIGDYKQSITMGGVPYDIAEIPDVNRYAVTLPYKSAIQFINKSNLKPGRTIKIPSRWFTYGIAATKQHIYVGGSGEIFVLDIDGSYKRTINTETSFIYSISFLLNTIYGCDNYSLFSIDQNDRVNKVDISGNGGEIMKIVIDKHGYIYIAENSRKIHRFTKDLKFDIPFGDFNLRNVTCICCNNDCSRLFVANDGGKEIVTLTCK